MNNRQTVILALSTIGVLAVVIVVGLLVSAPSQPQPTAQPVAQQPRTLTDTELTTKLTAELPAIAEALTTAYPQAAELYTITQGKLYDQGQWYGTTLTYRGNDSDNRDTLRVLMQKKDNAWIVRTLPPAPLLSVAEYPDVPKTILQAINQPAELPASDSSPAIE